jgi:hypothetical protein
LTLPLPWAEAWQATLFQWVPFDAAKGEEGVSVQGSLLIVLLLLIGATAWKGLDNIVEGANRWTWIALGLAATTLAVAALGLTPHAGGLQVALTGRVLAVALTLWAVMHYARRLPADDWQAWLWESWRFVKQIFLLLVVGVFVVGVIRQLIQPEWIQSLAGQNNLQGNAVAVVFGVFMYFPTLVEVPVARMFLDLGMHPGPLLAYLMADPELSLQSMLMVAAVDRPRQDGRLRRPGRRVQHLRGPAVRRLGRWRQPGLAGSGPGRVCRVTCSRLAGLQSRHQRAVAGS